MLVGWIAFRYALLGPEPPGPQGERELGLGKRYIDYLSESRLLRGRLSSLEKLCTEGKLSLSALTTQRIEIEKVQRRIDARLGVGADTAKRLLLQYGPGQSPLQNGTRGAVAGLLMAGLMQLTLPFDFSAVRGPSETSWAALLAKMAIDPRYEVITTSIKDSQLLMFLSELLNAAAVWTIAGFIFGYVFHRIRGQDGFVKGAVFGAGIGLPYVLSQALVSPPGGTPIAALGRMISLLVFLLVLGSLVFDGATLRSEKVSIAKLPELYGLRTSVGYLSFAGAVASIQPALDLLSHALK
jgi:hypothetical protein